MRFQAPCPTSRTVKGTMNREGARGPLTSSYATLTCPHKVKATPHAVVFTMSREVSREGDPFLGSLGRFTSSQTMGGTSTHGVHHGMRRPSLSCWEISRFLPNAKLLYEPSHESWSSPLAMKLLVKMSHVEAALMELLPSLHEPNQKSWSISLAVVVIMDLMRCSPKLGVDLAWLKTLLP